MTADEVLAWEGVITQLASLGVKSWTVIRAALSDAGLDDDAVAALRPRWDALATDVRKDAGLPPQ